MNRIQMAMTAAYNSPVMLFKERGEPLGRLGCSQQPAAHVPYEWIVASRVSFSPISKQQRISSSLLTVNLAMLDRFWTIGEEI
jgi:hypothetical protein